MTIVFQILAVIAIVIAAVFTFRGGGARHQAIRRTFMLLFIVAAASSVFFPQAWTWLANLLGIGRGADLLLYLLVLTFFGFVASTYRRFRQLEMSMTSVARQVALMDAPAASGDRDADQVKGDGSDPS
jgi:small membrane protein